MEQHHAQGHDGRNDEEVVRLAIEPESARTETCSQHIDQGESSRHQPKPQTNNVSKDVLVGKDLGLLCLSQLLQVGVSPVQQEVNQEPEHLLE